MGHPHNDPIDPVVRMRNVILGWSLTCGILLGIVLGLLMDNLSIGLLIGVPLGSLAGTFIGNKKAKNRKQQ